MSSDISSCFIFSFFFLIRFTNVSCLAPSEWCTIEHWVTLGCLYVGALFYSLLISSMSSILEVANKASQQFQQKLAQIEDYMRNKKLPPALREKVKEYFRMQHNEGKLYDETEILETITPVMRREIQAFYGRAISSKVPLLNSITNKSFAEEIAIELKPSYAFQDEILIKENTVGKEMYFILNGIVELFVSRSMDSSAYVTIGDGCYFGEVALILGCRRTATAKTKTQCVLYTLNRDSLLNILEDYPATSQYMKKIAASRQRRVRHFLNPSSTKLAPEDEIDLEDSKTELVGVAKSLLFNKKLQSKNML
jgi:predicted house-cleaning noncanonical NTP pyrophosphatase (MazG superfamily)